MEFVFTLMNTREWAMLIIALIALIAVLAYKNTRGGLLVVLRALFVRQILGVLIAGGLYVALCVYGLHLIGLWQIADLSATIIWTLTSASVTIFNFNKAKSEPRYYTNAVFQVFAFTSIFVFVTDLMNIPVWFWLIAIPVLSLIHLMSAMSKDKPEVAPAHTFFSWLEAILGFGLFFYVLHLVIGSWESVARLETLRLFALSGALSILFLPFIFMLVLYSSYEETFSRLAIFIKDGKLRRRAKWCALGQFGTDITNLERWQRRVAMVSPATHEALQGTFDDVAAVIEREKNPPQLSPQDGWQPQQAMAFLEGNDLATNDYTQLLELDSWSASSPFLTIGQGIMPNTIGYYVTGTAEAATRLRLKLNVNDPDDAQEAYETFAALCRSLVAASTEEEVAKSCATKLATLAEFEMRSAHATISLKREDWQHASNGHAFLFTILHKAHVDDL